MTNQKISTAQNKERTVFSDDDLIFLKDQSERHGLLENFAILFGVAEGFLSVLGMRFEKKLTWEDVSDVLDLRGRVRDSMSITPHWADAMKGLIQIGTSVAYQDTWLHLNGRYYVDDRRLQAPKGSTRVFFWHIMSTLC